MEQKKQKGGETVRPLPSFESVHDYGEQVTREGMIPGAVVVVGTVDGPLLFQAYGNRQVCDEHLPMENGTIFDLASVSKVVATLPAVLHLVESGHLDLHAPLISLKSLTGILSPQSPVAQVTITELLTHTAGLPAATYLR